MTYPWTEFNIIDLTEATVVNNDAELLDDSSDDTLIDVGEN